MPAYSKETQKWYKRAHWTRLRTVVIHRDPVCKICNRAPSTIADHIKPHKGEWSLFSDLDNLQGICKTCHAKKTAREDGGFGHALKHMRADQRIQPTGDHGRQFVSCTVGMDKINAALPTADEVAELLKGIV